VILSQEWKEALWDKFVTAARRLPLADRKGARRQSMR
jgi:hypothetical protein